MVQRHTESIEHEREATRALLDSHREVREAIARFKEGIARSQRLSDESARLQLERRRWRWF